MFLWEPSFFGSLPPSDEFLFVQTARRICAHDHGLNADLKVIGFIGLTDADGRLAVLPVSF